jgi:hypothetical protein
MPALRATVANRLFAIAVTKNTVTIGMVITDMVIMDTIRIMGMAITDMVIMDIMITGMAGMTTMDMMITDITKN